MKTLIIGRTSTGKDTLRELLSENFDWKFVKSTTTRPRRSENEDTHVFVSKDEADAIPLEDKVARTVINEYEYFATRQDVNACDAYIIDPIGAYMLLRNMPEEWFYLVYIQPLDKELQKNMAIMRADNPEKELQVFNARYASEDEQFTEFERRIADQELDEFDNLGAILVFKNPYEQEAMEHLAMELEMRRRFATQIRPIVDLMLKSGLVNHDDQNRISVSYQTDTDNPHSAHICIDEFIEVLYTNDEMLGDFMRHYLCLGERLIEGANDA